LPLPDARRISEMADFVELRLDDRPEIVAVSGAMYEDPALKDRARLNAALKTANGSRQAGVPHVFLLDSKSHSDVAGWLEKAGAIVVQLAAGEGGRARPYLTGSLIIDELVRRGVLPENVYMVKGEPEKNIFGGPDTPYDYLARCRGLDVAVGFRTEQTWDTMPNYLRLTESVLRNAILRILGMIKDGPSGILVLNGAGRKVFQQTTTVDLWTYLFITPFRAVQQGLKYDDFDINFRYDAGNENGDETFDTTRKSQFDAMTKEAIALVQSDGLPVPDDVITLIKSFRPALDGVRSTR
jgi:hypothetical protein